MADLQNIFDSHAHYDDDRFDADRQQVLQTLPSQGIRYILNAASDLSSSKTSIKLAKQYEHVYASVGVHPHEAQKAPSDLGDQLKTLSKQPKVQAIGEIGLDYHYDFSPRKVQQEVFALQLEVASHLSLPVIVHDREAHSDTLRLLEDFKPRGVVHCYSGSAEMAQQLVKLGLYIGFTGVITFKNARRVVEAAQVVPLDRLLVETDCPYMAPEPLRGKRCDSSMLVHTITRLAQIKGVTPQELADRTCQNAKTLYAIS